MFDFITIYLAQYITTITAVSRYLNLLVSIAEMLNPQYSIAGVKIFAQIGTTWISMLEFWKSLQQIFITPGS
jgi:hypothetical protein